MASKIIPAVLAVVCLQASVAVKDPECLTSCLSQQVGCSSSCENFIFGPEICQSICSSWGIRCKTNCPEVIAPATVPDEPAQPKPQPTSSETPEQGSVQGSATFVNRATCGRANFNRIVGGTVAGRCEYPWMVLIYNQVNHKICGGSIIGDREILTASHCLFSLDENTYQYEEARASHLIVFSGSSTMPLQDTFPERGLVRNYVAQVITYPEYSPSSARNDIAILKLRQNLPKDECHRQVCLVSRREARQRTRGCRTMGWGKTTNRADGEATSRMRWTSVTIESQERCRNIYGSRTANDATLCAGGPSSDSCSGDSGGPLVCRGDNGAFYQYGIVSLGLEGQCGRMPGLYTRVNSFLSWVAAQAA